MGIASKVAEEDPTFRVETNVKLVKQLSQVWVGFTWTSLLTVCVVSSSGKVISYRETFRASLKHVILQTSVTIGESIR